MEKKLIQRTLKEQVILEFQKKGLGDFITYFLAHYPNYPITKLSTEGIDSSYFQVYDIPFLASYIRYSDMNLLGSGMRDEEVRAKLCFLHLHVGTILSSYRRIIWSDSVTLEELKYWLPLFSDFSLKKRILKSTRLDEHWKELLKQCLDPNSYVSKNLAMLDQMYPQTDFELASLPALEDQEAFYKLLQLCKNDSEVIGLSELFWKFERMKIYLRMVSMEELSKQRFVIQEYLRESSYAPPITSREQLLLFCKEKEFVHQIFLEQEFEVQNLKQFYCRLFLGMTQGKFESIFPKIPKSKDIFYALLEQLYCAKFPLLLKRDLYHQFVKVGDLRSYIESVISVSNLVTDMEFKNMLTRVDEQATVMMLEGSNFSFVTMSIRDYQEHIIRKKEPVVRALVQNNWKFHYQKEHGILAFSKNDLLSYHADGSCTLKGKMLRPACILSFDDISVMDINLHKKFQIPIVIIDTEVYAQKEIEELEQLFEMQNWDSYFDRKMQLAMSLTNHPWLFRRFFRIKMLYQDVEWWSMKLEQWIAEKVPNEFLKRQAQILYRMIEVDEKIGQQAVNLEEKERETASQYKKIMIQYQKLI